MEGENRKFDKCLFEKNIHNSNAYERLNLGKDYDYDDYADDLTTPLYKKNFHSLRTSKTESYFF